jgi:hypothetical protein
MMKTAKAMPAKKTAMPKMPAGKAKDKKMMMAEQMAKPKKKMMAGYK